MTKSYLKDHRMTRMTREKKYIQDLSVMGGNFPTTS